MTYRAADCGNFIAHFRECARILGILEIEQAVSSLRELWDLTEPTAKQAITSNPLFADHGTTHPVRLANTFEKLLTGWIKGCDAAPPPLRDKKTLLFVFASFLLHDIGMSIPLDRTSPLDERARTQSIRTDHDERSLEFIERELIGATRKLTQWMGFWQLEEQSRSVPGPGGVNALWVLARICKSHGDHPNEWLKEGSLESYKTRTGDTREIQFPRLWNDKWNEFQPIIYCAATVLSLCDLCELGPDRFLSPPNFVWDNAPTDPIQKKITISHLVCHQVTDVEFKNDCLSLTIYPDGNDSSLGWSTLLPIYAGAGADLLYWGNKPILAKRIKEYIYPGFSGLNITIGPATNSTWDAIKQQLLDRAISDTFFANSINLELFGTIAAAPESSHLIELCRLAMYRDLPNDIDGNVSLARSTQYHAIASCFLSGILIDNTVSLDLPQSMQEQRVYDISIDGSDDGLRFVCDRFLAALSLASRICMSTESRKRIRLIGPQSKEFYRLAEGYLDDIKNSVFLVDVRDAMHRDVQEYKKLLGYNSRLSDFGIHLIFCGRGLSDYGSEEFGKLSSHCFVSKSTVDIQFWARAASSNSSLIESGGKGIARVNLAPLGDQGSTQVDSVYDSIRVLWGRGAGIEQHLRLIDSDPTDNRGLSSLIFISLVEFLSFQRGGEGASSLVSVEALQSSYRSLVKVFGGNFIGSWDHVSGLLPGVSSGFDVVEVPSALISALEGSPSDLHNSIAWIRRYVAGTVLQRGAYFNPSARPIGENFLQIDHAAKAMLWISEGMAPPWPQDEHRTDASLIVFGLFLGELIGQSAQASGWSVDELERVFRRARFSTSLKDCIRFQAAYRALRKSDDGLGVFLIDRPIRSPCLGLGAFEAACRAVSQGAAMANDASSFIANHISVVSDSNAELEKVVLFDILWKYFSNSMDMMPVSEGISSFVDRYRGFGFDRIAELFHSRSASEVEIDFAVANMSLLIKQWRSFRIEFEKVLSMSRPEIARSYFPGGDEFDRIGA